MRLRDAHTDEVVRNQRNGSFYRYVKPEGQRVRIRPLELFPNGLLIEKTADTIVEADLAVDYVGKWAEELYVEGKPAKPPIAFEQELVQKRNELVVLEAEAIIIDPKERGSHANKVKAVAVRVTALERGLARCVHETVHVTADAPGQQPVFVASNLVQLPSGLPAKVLKSMTVKGDPQPYARVRTRTLDGRLVELPVCQQVLRPWAHRRMATI